MAIEPGSTVGELIERQIQELTLEAVKRWLRVRQEFPGPPGVEVDVDKLSADMDHSALLRRLLDGKEPLAVPPPRRMSYPWYELIENGEATGMEVQEHQSKRDWGRRGLILVVDQYEWVVMEKRTDTDYTVMYRPDAPPFRVWKDGETWRIRKIA